MDWGVKTPRSVLLLIRRFNMIKRNFKSRLSELPLDFKIGIGELPLQKGMTASNKRKRALELLKKYEVPYIELGTGTNRFIVKYDGYAMKMALDNEGIADNKQEWVMSYPLGKGIAQSYEISKGGHFLMSQYAGAFQSYNEFYAYRKQVYQILNRWNQEGFLLGDVGICKINYANWGLLPTGEPVCIDYAYIFPANMDLFKCTCGCKNMRMNEDFTEYYCIDCGKKFEDRELRVRIPKETRLKLFSDVEGFEMNQPVQEFEIDERYLNSKIANNPDVVSDEEAAIDLARSQLSGGGYWYKID